MKNCFIIILFLIAFGTIPFFKINNISENLNAASAMCKIEENRSGCCSRHGGVCGCNKKAHLLKCCDGTLSASCGC